MNVIDIGESRIGLLYAIVDDGTEIEASSILGKLEIGSELCKGAVDEFYYVVNELETGNKMSKITYRKRHIDGNYAKCEECGNIIEIDKPIELDMPYCSVCGKIVFDANQKYCAWCGIDLENE